MKRIFTGSIFQTFLATFAAVVIIAGCKTTLDTAGPYAQPAGGGMFLFMVDRALVDTKDDLTAFLTWERLNHAYLASNAPSVVATADTIRDNAPLWYTNAWLLRSNFVWAMASSPQDAPGASNSLAAQVSLIQTATQAASALTNSTTTR
jgi:hypothetical protein